MRHRVAGNRINMPEARRRAAIRSLIDGLVLYEHVTTTEARAKAVQAEAERMITTALRGRKAAFAKVREVVSDENLVQTLWDLAGEAKFNLDTDVLTNEERAKIGKVPLTAETRRRREQDLADRKQRLLKLIKDEKQAGEALSAARQARATEVQARRVVQKHLPNQAVIKKLFSPEFFERYQNRQGGYTRITKVGRRKGDGTEMVRFELIDQL